MRLTTSGSFYTLPPRPSSIQGMVLVANELKQKTRKAMDINLIRGFVSSCDPTDD